MRIILIVWVPSLSLNKKKPFTRTLINNIDLGCARGDHVARTSSYLNNIMVICCPALEKFAMFPAWRDSRWPPFLACDSQIMICRDSRRCQCTQTYLHFKNKYMSSRYYLDPFLNTFLHILGSLSLKYIFCTC